MLFGNEDIEQRLFAERIAATAIVNQAAIKCMMLEIAINEGNVVKMIGDFADPSRPDAAGLIEAIMAAIDALIGTTSISRLDLNS